MVDQERSSLLTKTNVYEGNALSSLLYDRLDLQFDVFASRCNSLVKRARVFRTTKQFKSNGGGSLLCSPSRKTRLFSMRLNPR